MATLLTSHLDQISLCANSIASLPFPGPKIFTNALLATNDITALIRDTEQHERALFHLAPPPLPKSGSANFADSTYSAPTASTSGAGAGRRQTTYGQRQPRNKAVAAVLGGHLYQQTRSAGGESGGKLGGKGEIDVDVLLQGAEKLAGVYPIPGATDRISSLRRRHQQLAANIAHYEARVTEQARELQAMNRPTSRSGYSDHEAADEALSAADEDSFPLTREDLEREEAEIRELETKKKGLEDRVEGMERDLGGLMR